MTPNLDEIAENHASDIYIGIEGLSLVDIADQFKSAIKEATESLRQENESLKQQVMMDTQRFKEIQEHGAKMEVDMEQLRQENERLKEENTILKSQVDNADINLEQQKLVFQNQITSLSKDRERLDWLEDRKVSMNQLRSNPDAVKEYWHLYWPQKNGSNYIHFGDGDKALLSLRQAIDTAIHNEKEK